MKNLLSFIYGFIITTAIYLILLFSFLFYKFTLCGEELSQKESREAIQLYATVFIVLFTIFILYKLIKANLLFSAYGISIPFVFAIYVLFITGKVYYNNIDYFEPYERDKWTNSKYKPFKMAKTLVNKKKLIGMPKRNILNLMGVPKDTFKGNNIDMITYFTDYNTWQLKLYFKDDTLVDAYLYQEGLNL
ncbi:MAG: hypothetical protein K1X55_14050 [Chitinophagales bacterium]|nr:hypothetical protein [Chitinophagales bacterium]